MLTRLACHNIDEHFTECLNELNLEFDEVEIEKDISDGIDIGRKLHDFISESAENSFLYEYYLGIKDLSALTRNITKRSAEIEKKSKMEHIEIVEALLNGNEEQSENCMRNHLRNTCERIVGTYINDLKKTLNYLQS